MFNHNVPKGIHKFTAVVLLFIAAGLIFARVRLLSMPLERDEGEYAYMAQLMLKGIPPFQQAFAMKFPGIYASYFMILSVLGQTDTAIRFGTLCIILATSGMVYLLSSKFLNQTGALMASTVYLLLATAPQLLGVTANCEHFVLLPVAIGCYFLAETKSWRSYFFSGMAFGCALTIKQQALFFLVLAFAGALLESAINFRKNELNIKTATKNLSAMSLGAGLPMGTMIFWMWSSGVFSAFKFWCIDYARHYGNMWSLMDAYHHFRFNFDAFAQAHWALLACAIAGFFISFEQKKFIFLIGLLTLAASLAITPGYNFRPHYFLYLSLPLSLAMGAFSNDRPWRFYIALVSVITAVTINHNVLFRATPDEVVEILYPHSPFKKAKELATFIKEYSSPDERIGMLGSEPQINFYAQRMSATPYIYMYPLTEPQPYAVGMQANFMELMSKHPPRLLLHIKFPSSWSVYPNTQTALFNWIPEFLKENYRLKEHYEIRVAEKGEPRAIDLYERIH